MAGLSIFVNFNLCIRFSTCFTKYSDWIHLFSHAIWAMKTLFHPCCETVNMKPMRAMCTTVCRLIETNCTLLLFVIMKLMWGVIKNKIDICTVNLCKWDLILSLYGIDIVNRLWSIIISNNQLFNPMSTTNTSHDNNKENSPQNRP